MTKTEVQRRVLQNGKPIALDKFSWNSKTRTFSTTENSLVLDFKSMQHIAYKTGSNCTFDTGSNCTFETGTNCTFNTGCGCTFTTCCWCTFKTGSHCTFDTTSNCIFNTGVNCTFKTWSDCTFETGTNCTFNTGSGCTFDTGFMCTFNTASGCTWIIDGKKYNFAPLYLTGSRWSLNVYKPNVLKIGCEEHGFDYWLTNYEKIAEKNDASDVVDEYKTLIDMAYEWAKSKGWDK